MSRRFRESAAWEAGFACLAVLVFLLVALSLATEVGAIDTALADPPELRGGVLRWARLFPGARAAR